MWLWQKYEWRENWLFTITSFCNCIQRNNTVKKVQYCICNSLKVCDNGINYVGQSPFSDAYLIKTWWQKQAHFPKYQVYPRKQCPIYSCSICIKLKSYSFWSAVFCCFLCISSLCSCCNVSSDTPSWSSRLNGCAICLSQRLAICKQTQPPVPNYLC